MSSRTIQLSLIVKSLAKVSQFDEALPLLEQAATDVLHCERVTLYSRDTKTQQIVSVLKSGSSPAVIRVPVSFASIAGYTALSRKSLRIANVRDSSELSAIHLNLKFDETFDEESGFTTRSVMSVPVLNKGVLLGVLQFINKTDTSEFGADDQKLAESLAKVIAKLFHHRLSATNSPYELLIREQRISQTALSDLQAKALAERIPVATLIQAQGISAENLGESLEAFYQVPWLPYNPKRYHPHPISRTINQKYLKSSRIALLAIEGSDAVHLLIDDPSDGSRVSVVERFVGALETIICVGLPEDIDRYLNEGTEDLGESNLNTLVNELEIDASVPIDIESKDEVSVNENDSTVVKLVNRILADAKRLRASDIHVEPRSFGTPAVVRMRIDGICQEIIRIPATHVRATVSRIKIMSRLDIAERRLPQDGKFAVRLRGEKQEVRVVTIPTVYGEGVVMRLLQSGKPPAFEELDLSERNRPLVEEAISSPVGLFLVVGPTGSGKTTTLHAILSRLNQPETKIWTAEDPVEITQPGLQQVQVQPSIGFTFSAALRSFLRADPDVILVGEMRDLETASIGAEASLTGHFVLSTLHTNSAPETITRLLDLGLEPVSFADALKGILAQRLVRRLCTSCKQEDKVNENELEVLKRAYGEHFDDEVGLKTGDRVYRKLGCPECNQTGYLGRIGVHELLVTSDKIRELIYRNAPASEIRAASVEEGMRTLLQDGIQKIVSGDIDFDQLRRIITS